MNIRKWLLPEAINIYKSLWANDQVVSCPPSKLASLGVIFQPINSWSRPVTTPPATAPMPWPLQPGPAPTGPGWGCGALGAAAAEERLKANMARAAKTGRPYYLGIING